MRRTLTWLAVIMLPVVVIGGVRVMNRDVGVRNREWPSQMQYSPASRSQTANPVLPYQMTEQPPVSGTVPRGFQPFHYGPDQAEADRAGRELKNPFQPTAENLARGQYVFSNYCWPVTALRVRATVRSFRSIRIRLHTRLRNQRACPMARCFM